MNKKPRTPKQKLGTNGEKEAEAFLIARGYQPVTCNYRSKRREIDLIMTRDHTLVICEVKSLYAQSLGAPEYRVNHLKRRNIIRATWAFLRDHPEFENYDVRFDILIVNFAHYPARIRHYEGAFIEE